MSTIKVMRDGNLIEVDASTIPQDTPEVVKATLIERAKSDMLAWINDFLRPFTATAAQAEPLAWAAKEEAARAYPNGTPEQTAIIEVEASVTGEQPATLCAIIIGQADLYRTIIAFTTGLRRKTVAQIDTADLADIPGILDAAKAAAVAKAQELKVM